MTPFHGRSAAGSQWAGAQKTSDIFQVAPGLPKEFIMGIGHIAGLIVIVNA